MKRVARSLGTAGAASSARRHRCRTTASRLASPVVVLLAAALAFSAAARASEEAPSLRRAERLAEPVGMHALHAAGGVPRGWQFQVPPGDPARGRAAFVRLGCGQCHATGPDGPTPTGAGPDLSGMGSHHPVAYFAESILNPDAVLVDGPGYLGPDGRSVMPVYPELTLAELADLSAYLASLAETGVEHAAMPSPAAAAGVVFAELPAPPPSDAAYFLAQSYDVPAGKLAAFEEWFRSGGGAALLASEGLVGVETFVDRTRGPNGYLTVFAFRDRAALERFFAEKGGASAARDFDGFVGAHGHLLFTSPALYRVPSLSTGAALACRATPPSDR